MKVKIGKTVEVMGQSEWADFKAYIDSEGQLIIEDEHCHVIGVDADNVVLFVEALNELISADR